MGFRGEALPSIASVSRFTLVTCERENATPEGTRIILSGGKILEVKAAGSAPGTTIEVRQLFFNLPARRKFLRTAAIGASETELREDAERLCTVWSGIARERKCAASPAILHMDLGPVERDYAETMSRSADA